MLRKIGAAILLLMMLGAGAMQYPIG